LYTTFSGFSFFPTVQTLCLAIRYCIWLAWLSSPPPFHSGSYLCRTLTHTHEDSCSACLSFTTSIKFNWVQFNCNVLYFYWGIKKGKLPRRMSVCKWGGVLYVCVCVGHTLGFNKCDIMALTSSKLERDTYI